MDQAVGRAANADCDLRFTATGPKLCGSVLGKSKRKKVNVNDDVPFFFGEMLYRLFCCSMIFFLREMVMLYPVVSILF